MRMMSEEVIDEADVEADVAPAGVGARPRRAGAGVAALTRRDLHLLGLLGVARYLDVEQIRRLSFPGRSVTTVRGRLTRLAKGKADVARPYLRRVEHYAIDGRPQVAWALAPAGFDLLEAEEMATSLCGPLRRTPKDPGARFMDHQLFTSELMVRLLSVGLSTAPGQKAGAQRGLPVRSRVSDYAKADDPRLRWTSSEAAELPWSEYIQLEDRRQARVIRPDAVLELAATGERVFIETEMGTHSISAVSESKPGSTTNKLLSYGRFVAESEKLGMPTFYRTQYPDELTPRVLFLLPGEHRASSVRSILGAWVGTWERENQRRFPLKWSALTMDASVALFSEAVGGPAAPPAPAADPFELSQEQFDWVRRFFNDSVDHFNELAKRSPGGVRYPRHTKELEGVIKAMSLRKK